MNLEVGRGFSGDAGGDTYVSIENLNGSAQYDAVRGTGAANLHQRRRRRRPDPRA